MSPSAPPQFDHGSPRRILAALAGVLMALIFAAANFIPRLHTVAVRNDIETELT